MASNKPLIEKGDGDEIKILGRSKVEWVAFALNNIPLTVMAFITASCVIGMLTYEEERGFARLSLIAVVAMLATILAGHSVYMLYHAVGLEQEVEKLKAENEKLSVENKTFEVNKDKFARNNNKLKQQVASLHKTVGTLDDKADSLRTNLGKFEDLRKKIKTMADEEGVDLGQFLSMTNNLFDDVEKMTRQNQRIALFKVFHDLEFMDRSEGMSKAEFDRFIASIPPRYREAYLKLDPVPTFDNLKDSHGCVHYTQMEQLIEGLLQAEAESNAAASSPV